MNDTGPNKTHSEPIKDPPKTEDKQTDRFHSSLSWEALEYPQREKGLHWYTVLALIAAGFVILSLGRGDIITAALVVMAALAIAVIGARKPETVTISIEGTTIYLGEQTHYNLSEMKSFWIHYEPPDEPELLLHSSRFFMPLIHVPLGKQDPLELRTFLRDLLPEEQEEPPLADRIAQILRF